MVNQLLLSLHLVGSRPFWLIGQDSFWSLVVVQLWRTWPFASSCMGTNSFTTFPASLN